MDSLFYIFIGHGYIAHPTVGNGCIKFSTGDLSGLFYGVNLHFTS